MSKKKKRRRMAKQQRNARRKLANPGIPERHSIPKKKQHDAPQEPASYGLGFEDYVTMLYAVVLFVVFACSGLVFIPAAGPRVVPPFLGPVLTVLGAVLALAFVIGRIRHRRCESCGTKWAINEESKNHPKKTGWVRTTYTCQSCGASWHRDGKAEAVYLSSNNY